MTAASLSVFIPHGLALIAMAGVGYLFITTAIRTLKEVFAEIGVSPDQTSPIAVFFSTYLWLVVTNWGLNDLSRAIPSLAKMISFLTPTVQALSTLFGAGLWVVVLICLARLSLKIVDGRQ